MVAFEKQVIIVKKMQKFILHLKYLFLVSFLFRVPQHKVTSITVKLGYNKLHGTDQKCSL